MKMTYVNRKGFHIINVLIILDHRHLCKVLTNFNARFPRSVHDSYVCGARGIYAMLANEFSTPEAQQFRLLGDESYRSIDAIFNYCFQWRNQWKPEGILSPPQINSESYWTDRPIGIIKNRFRCIKGEKKLHYGPLKKN